MRRLLLLAVVVACRRSPPVVVVADGDAGAPRVVETGTATVVLHCDVTRPAFAALVPTEHASWAQGLIQQDYNYDAGDKFTLSAKAAPDDPRFDGVRKYVALPCKPEARFVVPAGDWTLYARAPGLHIYAQRRELNKTLLLRAGDAIEITYKEDDFKAEPSSCCHCPFVSVVGSPKPAFEVLVGRSSKALAGVDRHPLDVVVSEGRAAIRVQELEQEVTYLSAVTVELHGEKVIPIEKIPAALRRGEEVKLTFLLAAPDGVIRVMLAVEGYYVPAQATLTSP
jgi:hypothetical protein